MPEFPVGLIKDAGTTPRKPIHSVTHPDSLPGFRYCFQECSQGHFLQLTVYFHQTHPKVSDNMNDLLDFLIRTPDEGVMARKKAEYSSSLRTFNGLHSHMQ